jgi:hypothetical protein
MLQNDLRHRARFRFVALNSLQFRPAVPFLHAWLDSWGGIGLVAVGMARQGTTYSSRATAMRAGGPRSITPGGNTRSHIDGVDISRSVLRAGYAYEQAAGWWRRHPPLE